MPDITYPASFEVILDGNPTAIIDLPEPMCRDKDEAALLRRAQMFAFHRFHRFWEDDGMVVRRWHGGGEAGAS